MKSILIVLSFLFALIFFSQCEKYDRVYEIPDDKKFIFDEGGWFGSESSTYIAEYCAIMLTALNDSWSKYLDLYGDYYPCYTINFESDLNIQSTVHLSFIVNGCSGDQCCDVGGGYPDNPKLNSNDREYHNVYQYESWGQDPYEQNEIGYKIFWNMKYGIIRFEGINEVPEIYWDLIGKI